MISAVSLTILVVVWVAMVSVFSWLIDGWKYSTPVCLALICLPVSIGLVEMLASRLNPRRQGRPADRKRPKKLAVAAKFRKILRSDLSLRIIEFYSIVILWIGLAWSASSMIGSSKLVDLICLVLICMPVSGYIVERGMASCGSDRMPSIERPPTEMDD